MSELTSAPQASEHAGLRRAEPQPSVCRHGGYSLKNNEAVETSLNLLAESSHVLFIGHIMVSLQRCAAGRRGCGGSGSFAG